MADQVNESAVDQAAVDTARAEGQDAGRTEGATAERARIAAILGCDEAKDRPALAQHLAMNTDQTPEAAQGLLAVAAKETVEAPAPAAPAATENGTGFDAAMGQGQPNVGAGDGGTEAADDGSDVLALAAAFNLKGFNKKS